jgi:hypothetical protein
MLSCRLVKKNNALFIPADVVSDGLFTAGIEGPSFHENGNIYLVNFRKEGTIGVLSPDHLVNEFIQLPPGSVGNGIRVHPDGDLLVADYVGHNILKINISSKKIQIFAHNKDMNQPNDLAFHSGGFFYASDPDWKRNTGQIWLIRSDGSTFCLEKNMGTTNGIYLSMKVSKETFGGIKLIRRDSFPTNRCFINLLILDWMVCVVTGKEICM